MLGPTTPSITKDAIEAGSRLILRMLPTDDKQVDRIARLVENTPGFRRIVIASDSGNAVYSEYITAQLAENPIVSKRIVSTVEVSPTNVADADFCRLSRYDPDLLIVVGMNATGRMLVQSWEAAMQLGVETGCPFKKNLKDISVIFTDGCASTQF